MSRRSVLRLIDANLNRALEGLRVCEDIARLHLEQPALFRRIRRLRHAVARTGRQLPFGAQVLVSARDSRGDVGRRAKSRRVKSLEHLLLINLQRAKEALRVLEECTRLIAPQHAGAFQRLRFQTYDTERAILLRLAALRDR